MARVLVVDDDANALEFLRLFLTDEGHEVRTSCNTQDALDVAAAFKPNLVISDWLLADGSDGTGLLAQLRRVHGDALPAIFVTGMPSSELRAELGTLTNVQICEKPIDLDRLILIVKLLAPAKGGPEA